jgi:SAM-dependent methyltransferase
MSQEDSEYWARYYDVTVERPSWETVRIAIARFKEEDEARAPARPRFAVDLGCGAGRDSRDLLRAGWRVLAIDREPVAIERLRAAAALDLAGNSRARLETHVEDLATVPIPSCDLVNASLCLPFLATADFTGIWGRIESALGPGARFAAMLFGDRDDSAGEEGMTCLAPERVEALLGDLEIEHWKVSEEDTKTALGEPHHFHLIEFVARRVR